MIFQIFRIRNTIKDVREDPGRFAGSELRDVLIGIIILPMLISLGGLTLLFSLGYLHFLGGPYIIARIIFWIGVIVSVSIGYGIYKLIKALRKKTRHMVNIAVDRVRDSGI